MIEIKFDCEVLYFIIDLQAVSNLDFVNFVLGFRIQVV